MSVSRREALKAAAAGAGALMAAASGAEAQADSHAGAQAGGAFPVAIRVDASRTLGALRPVWRFFGCDEPNYATLPNGRKLIAELGALTPRPPLPRAGEGETGVYFRTHNLLTSGDGTPALKWGSTNAYTEDTQGRPVYDWTILDRIFDSYRERGIRPYVEIGFMPEALSTHPEPYRHHWTPRARYEEIYTGWAYPPKDYARWAELVHQWAKHCVARYGKAEVEHWYWEVWNEPNIGYWRGTPEEFHRLHDFAVAAVRRALPTARVGGPDVAGSGGRFMRAFLDHCLRGTNYATGEKGAPLDFVSFHAKGAPDVVDGRARMGIANHLRTIADGFALVASYPELKEKPIVIGESDPDGCAACQGPQLAYRNGPLYPAYTAACLTRALDLADQHGVNFEGALTWAFEFEDQPWFAGFRALATNGVDLPILNLFRMLGKMGGQRVAAESMGAVPLDTMLRDGVRAAPDVAALASLDGRTLSALVWHYHDEDAPGPAAAVELTLRGLPMASGDARLTRYAVDERHGCAYTIWKSMGSPQAPTEQQRARLERAGRLARVSAPGRVRVEGGSATLRFNLPRPSVSLVILEMA